MDDIAVGITLKAERTVCVDGRHTSYSNKEYTLMAVETLGYLKRELEKISDEATTDCYNEYEQIAGWCTYLEDKIDLPCKCIVGQKEGLLTGFDTNKDGSSLLAVIKVDMNEYKVAPETV